MKESGENARVGSTEHRLFLAYLAALLLVGLLTVHQVGITWDEPNYFTSSYSYLSWFGHVFAEPSDWWASIDRYWEQSHEAPPFFKLWGGLFAGAAALLFGFARLGQLDGAVASVYLLAALALYRMLLHGNRSQTVVAGVALGLAFATKLNVFTLVPAAL